MKSPGEIRSDKDIKVLVGENALDGDQRCKGKEERK